MFNKIHAICALKEEAEDKQITIDGEFITNYESIEVHQFLHKHHTFKIVLDIETLESYGNHTLGNSKSLLGKKITTNFSGKAFVGIVLDVCLKHDETGSAGEILISGLSQTVVLENGRQQKSWLDKDLATIVNEILETADIRKTVSPKYTTKVPYLCQQGESDYQYLQQLSYYYNEWFYYDGSKCFFGKPDSDNEDPIELEYGRDV